MPITTTYPGVYIEELPSSVHAVVGVATSITAFVGRAPRGFVNEPIRIQGFGEYERNFGGLDASSTMSFAVQQYFLNGGSDAVIVRVTHTDAAKATLSLPTPGGANLALEAASPGVWANSLRVRVDHLTRPLDPGEVADSLFNLTVKEMGTGTVETFRNVSTYPQHRAFVALVLEQSSALIRVVKPWAVPAQWPTAHPDPPAGADAFDDVKAPGSHTNTNMDGADGGNLQDPDVVGDENAKTGFFALQKADLFNLLCIPPLTSSTDVDPLTWTSALSFCKRRRAMLIVDPPSSWTSPAKVIDPAIGVDGFGLGRDENAVIYFPRLRMGNPLKDNRVEEFVPCGVIAGVMARTDAQRGVWKAPAGIDATLLGVRELSVKLTDGENGELNPVAVNCLRAFPVIGEVSWGARTMKGADILASQWKYLPIRRLALFIEESLYRGTQWAVFEPNDEPLWSQIRLNVGSFMHNLFRQGAFQGKTPRDAYLVKCDSETTTQADIDLGIVNILIGFAPLKPAEFVILKIEQLAGQVQA
jgi:phage tail sheath protein FI